MSMELRKSRDPALSGLWNKPAWLEAASDFICSLSKAAAIFSILDFAISSLPTHLSPT